MANLTKKQIESFNKEMIKACKVYGLEIVRDDESGVELNATKSGIIVRVMLDKFDNKYRSTLHTLHCQLYSVDRNNSETVDVAKDIMAKLNGNSHSWKYNCYPSNEVEGINHLTSLLEEFDKI